MRGVQAGINKAGQRIRGMAGKSTAQATRTAKTARSSGVMKSAKNSRMGKAIMKNPGRSAAIGAVGVAGLGLARSRRSGLNKGRSSMYNY